MSAADRLTEEWYSARPPSTPDRAAVDKSRRAIRLRQLVELVRSVIEEGDDDTGT